jgi:nucleoside-diphosphate kinase
MASWPAATTPSTPVIAAVFEGPGACAIIRATIGATDPAQAAAGTIRADFGVDLGRNLVHASDSPASGEREVALFFRPGELISWARDADRWIFE